MPVVFGKEGYVTAIGVTELEILGLEVGLVMGVLREDEHLLKRSTPPRINT